MRHRKYSAEIDQTFLQALHKKGLCVKNYIHDNDAGV